MTKNKKISSYFFIFIAALLYTISINMFLQFAGLFSSGIGAIAAIFTYISSFFRHYFSVIYLIINLPLILIYWRKIKLQFIIRTITFLIMQFLLGLPWVFISDFSEIIFKHLFSYSKAEIHQKVWPIIFLAMIASIIMGASVSLSWKFGGSSGGLDIIVYHYSMVKKKNVALVSIVLSLICVFFSFIITISINAEKRKEWFITISLTLLYVILSYFVMNYFFPKYNKVKIEIHSNKTKEIKAFLKSKDFFHASFITKIISNYNNQEREIFTSVILLLELKSILSKLKNIDKNVWVSVNKINRLIGNFSTRFID